jgi:predicted alpha/beta hydrolase
VRVLLDEHLPVDFAAKLKGHEVSTVRAQGWIGMKNGELLTTAAAAGFEVLLTNDRGIEQQQRLTELSLAVIILDAPSNKIGDLIKRLPATLRAIENAAPGQFQHVAG